ncbi:MAG TPA: chromosomal replication initiator protein DnaA, partial [Candidatus Hydrogenedentes bacterium]|nr:chromosomal replication initiator protein DnaA [Candidatus Hydrogenedentota bacterium]
LKHQMSGAGVPVPEEILSLIAMRVPGDVRKMIGALRKITAFARLIGKEISVEMAQEILSHLGAEEAA